MRTTIAASAVAFGLITAAIPLAGEASAACDAVDCVPNVARNVVAGAPLARVEGVITVNRMLDRMRDITISEAKHGAAEDRRYSYEPTFLLRGLTELHIDFTPVG